MCTEREAKVQEPTREFCERLSAIEATQLSPMALALGRQLVLDGIAIAVAGAREPAIQLLAAHHRAHYPVQGGAPSATALGLGFKLPPVAAAALNGAAMHVLDFEPMWSPANHALSTTLPVVLALAEQCGATGLEVLTALVKGCEAQGWLREASGQYEPRALIFHPPGVVGPIGAAVAAGHLLGLGADRLAHAIGIAASRSGALLANVGTMTKALHCGNAAAAGLEAALLASRGVTANPGVLEARQGLAAGFFPDTFRPDALLRVGAPFRIEQPGFALKMFPSQYGTHFAIVAALAIHRQLGAGSIARACLTAPVMPYIDRPRPATGLDGKFSLQYASSAALLDGAVTIASFTDARLAASDMQRLLSRFQLVMSPGIPAHFEGMHVELTVATQDGRQLSSRCDGPPGSWRQPPIPGPMHAAKIRDCLAAGLAPDAAAACIALAAGLDTLDAPGVRRLLALAGGAG